MRQASVVTSSLPFDRQPVSGTPAEVEEPNTAAPAPLPSQRTLAVDWGAKRTGLAICDELGLIARPLAVWPTGSRKSLVARVVALVAQEQVVRCVVGLACRLDGSPNQATVPTLAFVEALRRAAPVPVVTWNERLTSVAAETWLRERRIPRQRWALLQDAVAAAILLEDFLANQGGSLTLPEAR
ncbi:MAG: Holliday junction resolvase RuvX [Chloracidobacterium sp.]|uniref:Putative pre-16S rRNA nuclease n=1 Tax=Chloracidobacterium validum TaxID=2821543 RepID=A0ABX8BBE1_9BACT|nr:Holliday junction resolvase RuvX [Chloracidobacterium validum]QUW03722.1 Holliday junction resolvase RuvX [Chloracidobacterium validum]